MTDIVPALHRDDDYDDNDVVYHVFNERASVVRTHGEGSEGGTITEEEEAVDAGTGPVTTKGVGMGREKRGGTGGGGRSGGRHGWEKEKLTRQLGAAVQRVRGTVEGPRHSTCHCEVWDFHEEG